MKTLLYVNIVFVMFALPVALLRYAFLRFQKPFKECLVGSSTGKPDEFDPSVLYTNAFIGMAVAGFVLFHF